MAFYYMTREAGDCKLCIKNDHKDDIFHMNVKIIKGQSEFKIQNNNDATRLIDSLK